MKASTRDRPTDDIPLEEARARAADLREEIRRHDFLYYVEARPEISDARYDELFRRLRALEEAHPELATPDSPTQRVGSEPLESLPTVEHAAPMLSLDSTQEEGAVRRFDERIRKVVGDDIRYVLEPKLDGASLELVYEDGVLTRAVTRGNGIRGEGVLENVRTIPSVPLRLRDENRALPSFLSVRSEVLMRLSDFEELNENLVEEGSEPFANPRNAAAGALRQLDSRITAERPLHLVAYDILEAEGPDFATDSEGVEALRDWGLVIPDRVEMAESVEEILAYHRSFGDARDELDYEIDGIVVKLDDLAARQQMGVTSRHPRWALAIKFEPRKEVTRVERIALSVGRTGVLTPVALLLPVDVGGVTVSRASLHNREEVQRKDIREGDLVRIQRAGDVIPQVVERLEEEERERPAPFQMPETCPACGSEVMEQGPFTVCPNRFACPAQLKGRIVHFGSRGALDIEGLGEETAALLVERERVEELAHLFDLEPDDLVDLEGFGQKSATNLVAAIRDAKRVELHRFIFGLGIPEVGQAVARDLARHFGSLEALRRADREALEEIPGVGPKMSEQITAFLHDERNASHIDAILERGMELLPPEGPPEGPDARPLEGTTWVFTGGLERLTRSRAKELVARFGGRATSSVSSATDFVVAGPGAGSKLEKARELGIEVLDEEEFVRRMSESGIEVADESSEDASSRAGRGG